MRTIEKIKHARRVSAPLISINTVDQQATMKMIAKELNGKYPIVMWDLIRGTNPVNKLGENVANMTGRGEDDVTIGNPAKLLDIATKFPENTVVFAFNFNQFLKLEDTPAV